MLDDLDTNKDGDISKDELMDGDDDEFEEYDTNKDGVLDKSEITVAICSCDNELMLVTDQLDSREGRYSIEILSSIAWKNEFDFFEKDANNDVWIDEEEIEKYGESCVTTYDPFDRDGDGVPDEEDAFPDDPDEDTDTDGDGIGDNSDIIASVNNDVIWVSSGVLGLILVAAFGLMFIRSRRGSEYAWQDYQRDSMSEAMLSQMTSNIPQPVVQQEVPPALDLGPPVENVPDDMKVSDLYD